MDIRFFGASSSVLALLAAYSVLVACSSDSDSDNKTPSVAGQAGTTGSAGKGGSAPSGSGGSGGGAAGTSAQAGANSAGQGGSAGETSAGGASGTGNGGQASAGEGGTAPLDQHGLRADYFNGAYFIQPLFKQIDPKVDFNWGTAAPDVRLGEDKFSIRWTGFIAADHSEDYTFYVNSDDGQKLWINDQLVLDHWRTQPGVEWSSAPISLKQGEKVSIKLEYFERQGSASCQLLWSSASVKKGIVPEQNLWPADMTPDIKFSTYEAEDAVLANGALKTDCGPCSPNGAGYRVDLGIPVNEGDPPASIEFTVNMSVAGTYTVMVWFANEGLANKGQLKVNSDAPLELAFRNNTNTGGSSVFEPLEFKVALVQGSNKITVIGPTTGSAAAEDLVRIDRITIE